MITITGPITTSLVRDFCDQLVEVVKLGPAYDEIVVVSNSTGGSVADAKLIRDLLVSAKKDGYRISVCVPDHARTDSAAYWIASAARDSGGIYLRPTGSVRVHHFTADDESDGAAVRYAARMDDEAARDVLRHSLIDRDAFDALQDADTRLDAHELVEFGLADGIVGRGEWPPDRTGDRQW